MRIEILTIFPEYFRSPLSESLLGKAIASGRLDVVVTDLRQFATDKHRKVDDEPYGGGRGLAVPEVLLSGDHASIERWRRSRALDATRKRRPDLLRKRPEDPGEGGN